MKSTVHLQAIRTVVPENKIEQNRALAFMERFIAKTEGEKRFLRRVYEGTAIDFRHSVLADYGAAREEDFRFFPKNAALEPFPGTAARNALFAAESNRLAEAAASLLFPGLGEGCGGFLQGPSWGGPLAIGPAEVTHLVTVSCTGFAAPGFDLHLQKALGLSEKVERYHLGFMGCFAAFPALRLARHLVESSPSARVLIVGVELCTLHFQKERDAEGLVAAALFSDGASAMFVSRDAEDAPGGAGLVLEGFQSRVFPETGGAMSWNIGDFGFEMRLSSYVPAVIEANIGGILRDLRGAAGLAEEKVRHWAIHPGGRAILDRVAEALGIEQTALAPSYAVLRNYGNMSAVTLAFVLAELVSRRTSEKDFGTAEGGEPIFAASFGPGLTVEAAVLRLLPSQARAVKAGPKPLLKYGVPASKQPLLFADLSRRSRELELMDYPEVDEAALARTVDQFALINRLFTAYREVLGREVFGRLDGGPDREYTFLDLGCGGGDILHWLSLEAERRGLRFRITGLDPDKRILEMARRNCRDQGNIRFIEASIADLAGLEDYDFIFSNAVLHHIDEESLVELFRTANAKARVNLVLSDIARSAFAYAGYTIFAGLFLRNSLAYYDGRLSILRSFTLAEMEALLDRAGLRAGLEIAEAFPSRLYVRRPASGA